MTEPEFDYSLRVGKRDDTGFDSAAFQIYMGGLHIAEIMPSKCSLTMGGKFEIGEWAVRPNGNGAKELFSSAYDGLQWLWGYVRKQWPEPEYYASLVFPTRVWLLKQARFAHEDVVVMDVET